MRRSIRPVFIALIALVSMRGVTHASTQVWGGSAVICMPDDQTIMGNRYLTSAGSVKHSSTSSDLITLYCLVKPVGGSKADYLWVAYQDSDGTGTNTYVRVSFVQMSRSSGVETTLVTLDSNSSSSTGFTQRSVNLATVNFDMEHYVYYMRVQLDRGSIADTAILYTMSLQLGP